jgi:3-oxoacyl-[acyl-carrier protein] reductase
VGTATSEQGAAAISSWIGALSPGSRGAVLDVGSDASVEALFAGLTGAPEIVVNNAGITRDNLLMRMKAEEWNDVVSTNLSSLYRVCKASLRGMMKARYGRIINISSVVGLMGNAGQTNYAAAKAGMIGFTKSLAREIASRNITVNVIAPGFIDTDMTRALDEKQVQALRDQIPLARLGTSADIAAAAAFLASDLGGYITGETLNVNGGLSMH